ncbi:hypothetical protein WJ63_15185 [Burkholderia pyrrocinia]|uniref:phosphocholine cytidylyltransferase family protein n=1 Tax=Burkholderia stagnalis TaxID=1503054 RepID=UPI00031C62B9|nr:phosphocholine cytidylyltransferase family protein [Burkholderia stagnalis]KVN25997.1 hypothetical protein WJ63_15185 [Burkholderia pyrrocinia]WGS44506.1 phosphocholine cytidylyltransferase family protein [Burkholderia sp. JSH-S8]
MAQLTAVILCAGRGTRIRDLTRAPKCLLEIDGHSLLQRQITALQRCGVDRIRVVTGYEQQMIRDHVNARIGGKGIEFVHNPDYEALGNTHSMWLGIRDVTSHCLIFDGDLLFPPSILQEFLRDGGNGFVVGDGSLDDIECAKALVDDTARVRLLVDKRAVTPVELERYRFVGEAMGIIGVPACEMIGLAARCETYLSAPEHGLDNWEKFFNVYLDERPYGFWQTKNADWTEIDTLDDFRKAGGVIPALS